MEKTIQPASHSTMITNARMSLTDKWSMAAGATFVYFMVSALCGAIPMGSLIIGGPLALGYAGFALRISRGERAELANIFDGFNDFSRSLVAMLLMTVAIIGGMLLLIVPGIIIAFGLSQTFFILHDDKEISAIDALRESWEIMRGNKMDYFILLLRFLPWMILCVFTLFIGLFWLQPYMQVTFANFYETIRTRGEGGAVYSENDLVD